MVFYKILTLIILLFVSIEANDEKYCNVRGDIIPREFWKYWTGYYCYSFTNDYRLYFKYNFNGIKIKNHTVPATKINSTYFLYDFENLTSLSYIKLSFRTDHFFELWINCCSEAVDCCDNFMTNENIHPCVGVDCEYPCPVIWDGWTCFNSAKAGTIQKMKCSKQAYSTDSDVCELNSEKECFANGTWNQKTNYGTCAIAPVLKNRHNFHIIVLSIASVLSFPSVVIFFSFRSFRNKLRFILHRNLILVIIIRNLLTIMTKSIIILDALKSTDSNNVMDNNGVGCRILAFFENAAKNGMYACMLADGFYLHKMIVRAFADEPKLLHLYGAVTVLTFLPSLIWALLRGIHQGSECWMVDNTQDQWVSDGFRIVILVINFILLIDIIRVMVLKLKRGNTSKQTRGALRATLFLMPLFGVHIIFITNRNMVPSNTCLAEDIYFYASYLMEALQGILVALLFCYMNTEVHKELHNAFRKFSLYLEQTYDLKIIGKRNNFSRRVTTTTHVNPSKF